MIETAQDVATFFNTYAEAFSARDAERLADLFAYPAHIVSDAGQVALVPATSREQWIPRLLDLLKMYDGVGFAKALVLDLQVKTLSQVLVRADVRWELQDRNGARLYAFDTCYTLGRIAGALQIVQAISPNELARYQAFVSGRQ